MWIKMSACVIQHSQTALMWLYMSSTRFSKQACAAAMNTRSFVWRPHAPLTWVSEAGKQIESQSSDRNGNDNITAPLPNSLFFLIHEQVNLGTGCLGLFETWSNSANFPSTKCKYSISAIQSNRKRVLPHDSWLCLYSYLFSLSLSLFSTRAGSNYSPWLLPYGTKLLRFLLPDVTNTHIFSSRWFFF